MILTRSVAVGAVFVTIYALQNSYVVHSTYAIQNSRHDLSVATPIANAYTTTINPMTDPTPAFCYGTYQLEATSRWISNKPLQINQYLFRRNFNIKSLTLPVKAYSQNTTFSTASNAK
jgi:hypothetical protein